MKVLLVNKFHYRKGGSETYYFEVAEGLRKLGHEVVFFAMQDPRNEPCEQSRYFVSASEYNGKTSALQKFKDATSLIYSKEAKEKFEELLQAERPDVIHLNLTHRQITFSILDAPSAKGIPVVYTSHDYILVCPSYLMLDGAGQVCDECLHGDFSPCLKKKCVKGSKAKSLLAKAEADYLRKHNTYAKLDRIIAPSEFMRGKLIEGGFPDSQVVVMQNFAKSDLLARAKTMQESNRQSSFLYFGRLSKEKGVDVLIRAFMKASSSISRDWELVIAGEGPEKENLNSLVRGTSFEDRIKFVGFLNAQEVMEQVEKAAFAVSSSRCHENMPYSIIEAFACGIPVVGTRMGGIPELVVNDETGFLCNADDVDDMAEALVDGSRVFADANRYAQLQEKCREYVIDHCDPDTYINDLVQLYQGLLDAKRAKNA